MTGNYDFIGQQVDIDAPAASVSAPLTLRFRLDSSVVPAEPAQVDVFRNGALVAPCTGAAGTAAPDPCVAERARLLDGDMALTVLTSNASLWTFAVEDIEFAGLMLTLDDRNGAGNTSPAGSTVYFRPGVSGGFSVHMFVSDDSFGSATFAYPELGPGWSSESYTFGERAYYYDASAVEPARDRIVKATNADGEILGAAFDVVADATGPTATVECDDAPCSDSPVPHKLLVSLAADDGAGSGVGLLRYTTDGSEPTRDHGKTYEIPFSVYAERTIKVRAYDRVGNAGPLANRVVRADTSGDTSPPSAPALTYAPAWNTALTGNTVYFRPGVEGRLIVSAESTDDESGVETYTFPDLGSGWTGTYDGSSTGTPDEATYKYDISATAAAPAAGGVVRATNHAGLSAQTALLNVVADSTPPVSTIQCDGGPCNPWHDGSVTVTLGGTDSQSGHGYNQYTTDGSDPSGKYWTRYYFPFEVASTTTLKVRAYDRVENEEALRSELVRIDPTPPAAPTISYELFSLDHASPVGQTMHFKPGTTGSFKVTAVSSDGQSGLAAIDFPDLGTGWTKTRDGNTVLYAFDAGAAEPAGKVITATNGAGATSTTPLLVRGDTTPPTTGAKCEAVACVASYDYGVSVFLQGDDGTGAGTEKILYTTDGSEPTEATGAFYTGPFAILAGTTTVKARAYDWVGNVGPVMTQIVQNTADPRSVTPTLGAGAVTQRIVARTGGTITVGGAPGTNKFTLVIPPDGLLSDETITMTPVASIPDLLPFTLAAAVDLKPEGLQLSKAATLTIDPATPIPAAEETPFGYHGDGNDLYLQPLERNTPQITFKLMHFSTAGVANGTAEQREAQDGRKPSEWADQMSQEMREALANERECQSGGGSNCGFSPLEEEALRDFAQKWLDRVVWPQMRAAETDDTSAQSALQAYFGWGRQLALLGIGGFEQEQADLAISARKIMENVYDKAVERCKRGEFHWITRILAMSRQAQLMGMGDIFSTNAIYECLHFELDMDFEYDYGWDLNGSADFQHDLRLKVKLDLPLLSLGDLKFEETAEAQHNEFNYMSFNGGDPAKGDFLGMGDGWLKGTMFLRGLNFNRGSLASAPAVDLTLEIPGGPHECGPVTPGDNDPCTNWEHFTNATRHTGSRPHHWVNDWTYFHPGEVTAGPDPGVPAWRILGWLGGGRSLIAQKTYERERECPYENCSGDFTEEVTFKLYHRPQFSR